MKNHVYLEITCIDRIGMTCDILKELYNYKINIHSLEAFSNKVFIKCEETKNTDFNFIYSRINDIHGVTAINKSNVFAMRKEVKKEDYLGIIGNSQSVNYLNQICKSIAKTNSTVLILGESGTGKELYAKAIHKLSPRANNKFVVIDCASIPVNLIEHEFFGYEKGSFTDANENGKEGLFKIANEGTIFLDEIGELPLQLQPKLLRVLQEGIIRKVGSNIEEKIDIRVIAATNRNLQSMIKEKKFREDLYYRLNIIPICTPPLRERKEDIPLLIKYFMRKLNKTLNKNIKACDEEFLTHLLNYDFHGNIRELQNIVERAMNLCRNDILKREDMMIETNYLYNSSFIKDSYNELPLKDVVETAEKEAIIKAINKYKSFRQVAKALDVCHATVINKIKKYDIECKG